MAALLSKLFSFALDRGLIQTHVAQRLPRPGTEQQRDRVLTEDELRVFWSASESLAPEMRAFYRLRLLTAQRGGEVAGTRWDDIDLNAGWWNVPAASSKNKLAHRVPLNATALNILRALRAAVDDTRDRRQAAGKPAEEPVYVLDGARGKRQQAEAAAVFVGIPDFRGHDLRRTVASLMASSGIPRLTISKVLNHAERSVTAVYDRHSYDPEKRTALTWWDTKLKAVLEGDRVADVVPFSRVAV